MRKPVRVVETLTVNDDFTDHATDLPALLKAHRPAFLGAQETKRTHVRARVRHRLGLRYGVRQHRATDASAGVAVAWDRWVSRAIGKAHDPESIGGGWLELTAAGSGLLARGVVWQDLEYRLGWLARGRIRIASTHRPPRRDAHLWPIFDRHLELFIDDSPLPVVVFMDANEAGGPGSLATMTRTVWRGVGIDGALLEPTLVSAARGATALPRRRSDHHAVSIPVRL